MKDHLILHEIGKDPLYKTWNAPTRTLFLYVYSDGGSIVTRDRIFPMKKGTLVMIGVGTYHYTMPENPDIYDRSKFFLSSQKFSKVAGLLRESAEYGSLLKQSMVYAQIDPSEHSAVDRIYQEIAACKNTGWDETMLLSCVLRLLFFLNKYAVESITPSAAGFMGKAIQYINGNIASELDIDGICQAINVSKYYFCRQFKYHTGQTVMAYILNTRIILAQRDLEETNASISEISEKFGFSSASYFSRVFREATGCTPLQYRRKTRN